jgi:hypothetical protein
MFRLLQFSCCCCKYKLMFVEVLKVSCYLGRRGSLYFQKGRQYSWVNMSHLKSLDSPKLLQCLRFRSTARIPRSSITPLRPRLRRTVLGANCPVSRISQMLNNVSPSIDTNFVYFTRSLLIFCVSVAI